MKRKTTRRHFLVGSLGITAAPALAASPQYQIGISPQVAGTA